MKTVDLQNLQTLYALAPSLARAGGRAARRPAVVAHEGAQFGWSESFQAAFDELAAAHGAPCTG